MVDSKDVIQIPDQIIKDQDKTNTSFFETKTSFVNHECLYMKKPKAMTETSTINGLTTP